MGYKQSPGLMVIVVALLLLAVATPLAYGQTSVNVNGRLCCTSNGNCPPGSAGIPGVVVGLNCTNLSTGEETVSAGTTNNVGQFGIQVPINGTIRLDEPFSIPCVASVNLPLNSTNCPSLNTATGTLVGMPLPVSTGTFLSGPVANITVPIVFNGNIGLNA